jgi:hypothetical protein
LPVALQRMLRNLQKLGSHRDRLPLAVHPVQLRLRNGPIWMPRRVPARLPSQAYRLFKMLFAGEAHGCRARAGRHDYLWA